jgi:molybdate transport system substrate-binding protein
MPKLCLGLLLVAITCALSFECAGQGKILLAAASDLKFALDSIIAVYRTTNGVTVEVTYGSSGKLFEQISNGAPFDIFFSADISYPKELEKKNLTSSELYVYGVGRVVLWSSKIDPQKEGMKTLLSPVIKKIAIANPTHAPYGKRAEEALKFYNVYDGVKGKLVLGENISQTAQFVTTGAADIGIVAYSLALSPNMKKENGKFFLIPENSHQRLEQAVVITKRGKGNDFAQTFLSFVKSDDAKLILSYFGFK